MPEEVEQPGQAPEAATPEAAAPAPKKKRKAPDVLSRLKKKYRLDDIVDVKEAGPDGRTPLGKGPLLDPEVFNKFAELDPTPEKSYLDWMLFQAGGGTRAFQQALEMWGDTTREVVPDDLFRKFNAEVTNRLTQENINEYANRTKRPEIVPLAQQLIQASSAPDPQTKFANMKAVLEQSRAFPGKEDKIAGELSSFKLKNWIKKQIETKVRDRVHCLFIWSKTVRGVDRAAAEAEWKKSEPKRRREYIFGDQDSLKGSLFGFARHWPGGRDNRYEHIYNEMRQFLIHKERVERRNAMLDQWNAKIAAKNKELPPDQQIPLREPIDISFDIGKVQVAKGGNLVYKGEYPTLQDVVKTNQELANLPMRERIHGDVRYAGQKGKVGRSEKLYSDENIDVWVPLTLAAAVRSGHPEWDISDPEQLKAATGQGYHSSSAWTQYHAGLDVGQGAGAAGMATFRKVPIMLHVKAPVPKGMDRVLMVVSIDDLVNLEPPFMGIKFRIGATTEELGRRELTQFWKQNLNPQAYASLLRSFAKAFRVIRDWGGEFDPRQVVADPSAYHRERMGQRRGLREEIEFRARQAVELLLR